MLLVALGCGRLPGILGIASKYPFIVFGTMDGTVLSGPAAGDTDPASNEPAVHFYETG